MRIVYHFKIHNMEPTWKIRKETIGDLDIRFESETYDGRPADTKVFVNGGLLCWICYDEIQEFLNKLQSAVSEHRI